MEKNIHPKNYQKQKSLANAATHFTTGATRPQLK
jgi:ribosomal protein L31